MDTIEIKKKERAEIEKAYDLVNGINFPGFVDFIKKHQPEFLKVYPYYLPVRPEGAKRAKNAKSAKTPKTIKKVHIGVDEKPDIDKILWRRNTLANSALGKYIERYKEYPTPEFKLQDNLNMLAKFIITHEDYIHKIRRTNFPFFDMERIGEIWAYAELFLKYKEVLQGLEQKVEPEQENKKISGILDRVDELAKGQQEVLQKLERINDPPEKPKKEKPPLKTLEEIIDKRDLEILTSKLIEKGFACWDNERRLKWTGIKHDEATGRGSQLVALTNVCKPLYKKMEYSQTELYHAWTTYFNFKISPNMFSKFKRPREDSIYHRLYNNLLSSFNVS